MATEVITNRAVTNVTSGGTTAPAGGTVETWTVVSSSGFPAAATGVTQFHIADVAQPTELIAVTNVSGTTWTVTRGDEGTTPVAHAASGFTVYLTVTAGFLNGLIQFAPTPSGDTSGATDSANLQAAINSVGNTASMRAVRLFLAPGNYVLNTTLLVQKKSVELAGCGWGAASSGTGTTITWAGSAGMPILRLWDSWGSRISRIRFVGLATAKPSAAISMYNITGDPCGNSFSRIEQCWFGQFSGFDTASANALACGVLYEGDNINDDQSVISGSVFQQCDTGVQYSNAQNVINKIEHCYFYSNGVHVATSASIALDHTYMSHAGTRDLDISASIVTCTNFNAEGSAQLAQLRGGSQLLVKGGYWQVSNTLTGSSGSTANIIDAIQSGTQAVKFEDFRFPFQGYTNPATAQIAIGQTPGGSGAVQLTLENCSGLTDVTPSTTGVYPSLQSGGNTSCHLLLEGSVNGASLNTKQRFRTALDETNVGFGYPLVISFGRYDVPGGAIGSQAAYAVNTAGNITASTTASTWVALTNSPSITLPNDGNAYRVAATGPSVTPSATARTFIALGTSTSSLLQMAMYYSTEGASQAWAPLNLVLQKVTGSGQTVSLFVQTSFTGTVALGSQATAPCELAAYRVA